MNNLQQIRDEAWNTYCERKTRKRPYKPDQLACFMAGMSVMWRLFTMGKHGPLFTYGPDSLPREISDNTSEWAKRDDS